MRLKPFKKTTYVLLAAVFFFSTCRSITEVTTDETAVAGQESPHGKSEAVSDSSWEEAHPVHENITATCFFVGEHVTGPGPVLDNRASAWTGFWVDAFGDIDHPDSRDGFFPAGFVPRENPFYCALPYNDLTATGYKDNIHSAVPWVLDRSLDPVYVRENVASYVISPHATAPGWPYSYCKNRWVRIEHGDRVCYAQWEDVGPFETDDWRYVFGNEPPKNPYNGGAGIDLSPACALYLGISGSGVVSWRFTAFNEVPGGPWKKVVTTSDPCWE